MFLKRYLDFWGMAATPEEIAKLPLEISVAEDGTGLTMTYAGQSNTLKFGEATEITDTELGRQHLYKSLSYLNQKETCVGTFSD